MVGKNLSSFGLQSPDRTALNISNRELANELSYSRVELSEFVGHNEPRLNTDQRNAFDRLKTAIHENRGGVYFLDAPGGTGKTFLINLLLAEVRSRGEIILAVASSGIAATLLAGGKTAHSTFKLPLDLNRESGVNCNVGGTDHKAELFRRCKAIIWDECTMSHRKAFEAVSFMLKDLRNDDRDFGGIVVVLAGDFRQTLPVIPRSTPADTIDACLKSSNLWQGVQQLRLTKNMRIELSSNRTHAAMFSNMLLALGDGRVDYTRDDYYFNLPADFCNLIQDTNLDKCRELLISSVFGNFSSHRDDQTFFSDRAILSPLKELVDDLNLKILEKFEPTTQSRVYYSVDSTIEEADAVHYPVEVLNSLKVQGLPPHQLDLKVGAPIILLRNLHAPILCHGTRLVVTSLQRNVIGAKVIAGRYAGESVFIPRIPLNSQGLVMDFRRLQFPIRLAFAMTINKSQGQSLKVAGVFMPSPCFSHGQLYVACSRVGSKDNLYIYAPNNETKNVVYRQVLG